MALPGPSGPSGYGPPADLRGRVLGLLGEYGSWFPSYKLPEGLDRRFGAPVGEAECRRTLDALIAEGLVRSSPDQPALVALATEVTSPKLPPETSLSEAKLMPHLNAYLDGDFRTVIEGGTLRAYAALDTSKDGPKRGTWRRPDFTVINVIDLPLLGRRQVDVHSFELKTEAGCSVPAVFEALSQARETHYGYLAWELPTHSPRRADLPEIEATCTLHGIGLILMEPGREVWSCGLRIRPRRRATDDVAVHGFLDARLDKSQKAWLRREAGRSR